MQETSVSHASYSFVQNRSEIFLPMVSVDIERCYEIKVGDCILLMILKTLFPRLVVHFSISPVILYYTIYGTYEHILITFI